MDKLLVKILAVFSCCAMVLFSLTHAEAFDKDGDDNTLQRYLEKAMSEEKRSNQWGYRNFFSDDWSCQGFGNFCGIGHKKCCIGLKCRVAGRYRACLW